jgi:hypothetical protein
MAYNPNNPNGQATMANSEPVVIASDQSAVPVSDNGSTLSVDDGGSSLTVDGTVTANAGTGNFTVVQSTAANLNATVTGTVTANAGTGTMNVSVQNASIPVTDNGGSLTVDGTVTANAGTGTFAVSATSLPLPTGAATEAKQPALGTAGTPSADVITVQGAVSMTALKVDGSAVTQPVSGTVTANAGTGTMNVSVQNASIPVTDNGGSLTVDGTVAATQSGTWTLGANSGVDIGDVTVNNAGGASAVNIQDGGNSITVDGTVTANAGTGSFTVAQSTATSLKAQAEVYQGGTAVGAGAPLQVTLANTGANATAVKVDGSAVTQPVSGTVTANAGTGTMNVSVQNASIPVTDNGGSLTVDGSVSITGSVDTELPSAAALADGASNPTTPTVGAAALGFNGSTWDRLETATVFDGNTEANYSGVLAVKQVPKRVNPTALGTATNSASTVDVSGSCNVTVAISTTTTGTFVIEGTADNTNWGNIECFDVFADTWVSGTSITPTAGKVYSILAGGMRQVRIRTNATLGATVTHYFVLDQTQEFIAGIDTGPAPHNFGYALIHKDGEYSTQQTTTALWTPATGKRFVITDLTISTGSTTSGIVTVYDAAASTAYSVGTTPAIFRGEFAPSANAKPGVVKSFNVPYYSAAVNNRVHITTSAAMTVYIQVNGYEI